MTNQAEAGATAAVTVGPDGRAVVVKAAGGPKGDRLRHEAKVLGVAAHPGVVEVVALAEGPDGGATLTTAFAGTAATAPLPDAAVAARLLAVVAGTLADLHDRGVAHGRLAPDHVLVGLDGAAVLCGFGGGALPGTTGGPTAGDDVVGLADLADRLLGDHAGKEAGAVRSVVARVRAADPEARPTMRALAGALAPPTGPPSPGPRLLVARRTPRAPTGGRRPALVAALAAGAALLVAGLAWAAVPGDGARDADATGPAPTTTAPATTTPPPTAVAVCPPVAVATAVDVDGDGCDEAVDVDGATLALAGVPWSVGRAGDVAAVGDWDCDGRASPAVLRPDDGSVWVYGAWGEGEVAVPVGTVPGAIALRAADPDADGCESLLLQRGDGTTTVVDAPVG